MFQITSRLEIVGGFFLVSKNILGNFKQAPAGIGQGYDAALSEKKFNAELLFQRLDLFGDGRLANAQHLGSRSETAFPGNEMKGS